MEPPQDRLVIYDASLLVKYPGEKTVDAVWSEAYVLHKKVHRDADWPI